MHGCRTGMMLDEIKCVTPNPIAHMPIRIAKRCIRPTAARCSCYDDVFVARSGRKGHPLFLGTLNTAVRLSAERQTDTAPASLGAWIHSIQAKHHSA